MGAPRSDREQRAVLAALFQFGTKEVSIATELRVNDRIRAPEVRVVAPDGSQVGVKKIDEARWLAEQLGLDLVEVAPEARPPVCRLMDYGKWKYEQSVKSRESRKKQTRTVIKEVKLRPKIDGHDFEVKRKRAERFLDDGDKVKVTLMFRGRELSHPEIGRGLLTRMAEELSGVGVVEQTSKLEGRNMTMVIAPDKKGRPEPKPAPAKNPNKHHGKDAAQEAARVAKAAPPPAVEPKAEAAPAAEAESEPAAPVAEAEPVDTPEAVETPAEKPTEAAESSEASA